MTLQLGTHHRVEHLCEPWFCKRLRRFMAGGDQDGERKLGVFNRRPARSNRKALMSRHRASVRQRHEVEHAASRNGSRRNSRNAYRGVAVVTNPAMLVQPEVLVVVSFAALSGLRRTRRGWTCEPELPTRYAWCNPFWPAVRARRRSGSTKSAVGLR